MGEISILDLQNLRHLIGGYATTYSKMTDYASQTEDPEVKKLFQDAAEIFINSFSPQHKISAGNSKMK